MYRLDRLDLNGFKSFSSPTEFTFGAGITAVVGPNGCGKSNIADAITWVIGEQGTRSLRAEHMGDVIFNGTDARRPMGMAEVSLRLTAADTVARLSSGQAAGANGNGSVDGGDDGNGSHPIRAAGGHAGGNGSADPIETFASSERPEIVITRRLFRSGESEYLIDGRKARLRDIQELLAEIRVGSGIYSVIEQGRVSAILTSRPRDRRVIIEEAAGIALYKVRKRQAQGKLEATEANLLRIHDIVSEIERQIGALKRQAARARRYARIAASIERGERILFYHEARRLEAAGEALRIQRLEIETEEVAAATGMARVDAQLAAGRADAAGEAARHQSAREALHALDRVLDQLKAGVDRLREQETEAIERMTRGAAETEALRDRREALRLRIAAAEIELDAASAESGRSDRAVSDLEATLRLDASGLQAIHSALAAAREEAVSGAGALSECRNEIRRLEEAASRGRNDETRFDRLAADLALESQAIGAKRLAHETGTAEIVSSASRIRAGAEGAAHSLAAQESSREALLLEREERRGRLAALEERLAGLKSLDLGPRGELADGDSPHPYRRLKDLLSPPERLDRAVDAALNGLLRGYLTPSVEEAAQVVTSLKARGAGRAVLIPLASGSARGTAPADPRGEIASPEFLGTLHSLLGIDSVSSPGLAPILDRVAVVTDIEAGLSLRAALPGMDIVTLQGDLLSRDGWIEGGAEVPAEAGVMTLKRLLERLATDAEAARARIARLDVEIEGVEAGLPALREGVVGWRKREANLTRDEESMRLKGEALSQEETRLALREQANQGDLERVREDLAAIGAARQRIRELHDDAIRRHDELQRVAESLSREAESLRDLLAIRSASVPALRAESAAARDRRSVLEAELRHLAESAKDIEARVVRETDERGEWERRLEDARRRLGEDSRALSDRMAERILADGAVASADALVLERRRQLSTLEESVRQARGIFEEVRERLHAHALEEERLAGDSRGVEARVLERGLPSLAEAIADLTDEERGTDAEAVRAEMAQWKERRDAMGAVNLMAMDQFRELEERFTFVTSQRRDLEESIRSLKETIARINRQSRDRFMEAFERIRTGFGDIFKILFGGGRADLRLVSDGEDDGDLLEAGLEISAQPPGKRLQSISLLSGGEKALTAIALLFAIFRYSPSPFCLLDEVDAPLDEANVVRFNTLLQAMSAETQFILITHNRRSMEAAGLLYGITMEEPGVSRSISVVMASEDDRREAARTLPAMLASRHRGSGGRPRPPGPPSVAGHES